MGHMPWMKRVWKMLVPTSSSSQSVGGVTEKVAWLTSRKSHGAVCYTGDSYSLEYVQDPQGFIGLGFSSGYIDFFHLQ